MIKKLRQNRKNKKGFTLVELIVVIVIILVLAAVMVPSVLRYVEKARQANCKADAATILVDLQAQVADAYSEAAQKGEAVDLAAITTAAGTSVSLAEDKAVATTAAPVQFMVDQDANSDSLGDVTFICYFDGRYYIDWTSETQWTEPTTTAPIY